MSQFHSLRVSDVQHETRDAVVLTLNPSPESQAAFAFIQGQHLTIRARIDGEEVRRSYSICSAVGEPIRIGIKKISGGHFSTWANEKIVVGQELDAMAPSGNFYAPLHPDNARNYVGFAAGSGITPLLGIIKTTLATEPRSKFTLFYGNRASSTVMFREALEDLKNEFMERFSLVHVLSREQQDIELFNGRLNGEKCDALLDHWIDPKSIDFALICGPQDMMTQIAESLQAHGLLKSQIKFELFAASQPTRPPRATPSAEAGSGGQCEATIIMDGRARTFAFPKNMSLLEAASREGIEAPFACKSGVCSTCRAKLIEGEVDMDANFALEDYEVARGYILTCQSFPVTDRIVVDYDK
jgi:ring-1,2-phenylacetyl-CoA epoxidase subunit PaaE